MGTYYSDLKFSVEFSGGNIGFDTADKNVYIFTSTGYVPLMVMPTNGFLYEMNKNMVVDGTSSVAYDILVPEVYMGAQNVTTPESIVIGTWGADSTIGNGTMLVKIWYKVRSFGTEL